MYVKLPLMLCFLSVTIFSQSELPDSLAVDIQPLIGEGVKNLAEGNYAEALELIQQAIQIDAENPELYRLEAQLFEMLDRSDKAIESWRICLKYTEDNSLIEEANHHIDTLKGSDK